MANQNFLSMLKKRASEVSVIPKMINNMDFSKVVLSSQMVDESEEDIALLKDYLNKVDVTLLKSNVHFNRI